MMQPKIRSRQPTGDLRRRSEQLSKHWKLRQQRRLPAARSKRYFRTSAATGYVLKHSASSGSDRAVSPLRL